MIRKGIIHFGMASGVRDLTQMRSRNESNSLLVFLQRTFLLFSQETFGKNLFYSTAAEADGDYAKHDRHHLLGSE